MNEETDRKIETAKSNYYKDLENKLSNSKNDNIFWSVVNRLVGRNKKMTNIPPLLEHGNFVTSFQEKADLFNKYFANQCNPIENGSVLPDLHVNENKLSDINVDVSQISSIISKPELRCSPGICSRAPFVFSVYQRPYFKYLFFDKIVC